MVDLPPRTPLENHIAMKAKAEEAMGMSMGAASMGRQPKKKRDPVMMNAFVDQLTEAYALCSAHEQMSQEIDGIRGKANAKCGVTLPPLPGGNSKPVDFLKTLLSKSGSMGKGESNYSTCPYMVIITNSLARWGKVSLIIAHVHIWL